MMPSIHVHVVLLTFFNLVLIILVNEANDNYDDKLHDCLALQKRLIFNEQFLLLNRL